MNIHRDHRSPRISAVRSMTREDLAALQKKSASTLGHVMKLRDSHHKVARLLASGMNQSEVAAMTGYSANRMSLLANSPTMIELIAHYRNLVTESWKESQDEYYAYIFTNGLKAQRMISDQLDEADDSGATPVPLNRLLAIAADSADRVGYTKKSTTVNINVDFAAKLEAARRRSMKVIDSPTDQSLAITDAA
jgi:hypothetical protein